MLILGTMPGEASLGQREYYANPRNAFWKILCEIFGRPYSFLSYDEKCSFLKENRIAIWDVYAAAERKGSLDSAIKNGEVNDVNALLSRHRQITKVLFNGKEAFRVYEKHFVLPAGIDSFVLPSTSPANTMGYGEKLTRWKAAFDR